MGTREPLSALGLVRGTFGLYRRYPLLFLALAAAVIVPYEAIVLLATGAGPFEQSSISFGTSFLLTAIDWVVVGPLVSALHVHAVADARQGRQPALGPVAIRGIRVLPVVAATTIISALGTIAGSLLVIPGIILWLRWSVAAQAAAIENDGWLPALRSSRQLAEGNYRHVALVLICVLVISLVPTLLLGAAFGHHSTDATSFVVGLIVRVLTASFSALATALLYFDLRLRNESSDEVPPASGHPSDPRNYSNEDRPPGWYVDPDRPGRMRYWQAGDSPGWKGSTRTPGKLKRAWRSGPRAGS